MTSYLERHASKSPGRKNTILQAARSKHSQIQKIVTASLYCALQIPVRLFSISTDGYPKIYFPTVFPQNLSFSQLLLIVIKAMGNDFWIHSGRASVDSLFFRVGYVKDKKRPCFCQYPSLLKALFFWKNSPPLIMKR